MSVPYDVEFNSAAHLPSASIPDLAERAEAAGFSCVWKGESNSNDPMVLLSAMAARTTTLLLGTGIYHIYGRSPATLGIQATTLQDLSGGRLLLGLGVANQTIAAWHGGAFDHTVGRIREYVEIVRGVTAGERVEARGKYFDTGHAFRTAWRPAQPPPPIYLAAFGDQMTRLAGQIADGVLLNMASPDKIRASAALVRQAATEAGRDPHRIEIIAKVRVSLHPDLAVARQRLRQVMGFYNIAEFYSDSLMAQGFPEEVAAVQAAFKEGGMKAAIARISDDYMDRLPIVPGTSIEAVLERLQPFVDAGATRLIVPYVPAGDTVVEDTRHFLQAWGAAAR